MDSHLKYLLYDFITKDAKKLEMAFDIGSNWNKINEELISDFQKEIKNEMLKKMSNNEYIIDAKADNNYEISIYNPSWLLSGKEAIFCIKIGNMKYDDYFGVWIKIDDERIKKKEKEIINEILSQKTLIKNYGLFHDEDEWYVVWKYTGYNYSEIEFLKRLSNDNRKVLVAEYAMVLSSLAKDFSPHIDNLVKMISS